jgi:type II restriction enzyme
MPDNLEIITYTQQKRRTYWVAEIEKLSGTFTDDFERLKQELATEITTDGSDALLAHLRLSGAIPEHYGHDSSEEKLYSKYTDALLAEAFGFLGLTSLVLQERADAADVECVGRDFSFVADAKAFRLSRTAKNQKDFKIQAMDGWKRGKPYAIVVCPVYQLPTRSSQIYQQAITRDVCVFTYSHLSVLVQLAEAQGQPVAEAALLKVFKSLASLNPTKNSEPYWKAMNNALLSAHPAIQNYWRIEKLASLDAIAVAKEEALRVLAAERERIMRLSKEQALQELVSKSNISNRESVIKRVSDTGILTIV